ncbi:MAG: guanylate kinase [Holosporales bacterium]|jgi:guanylate kinase|nr:guanylate kinase [Holosporales bacterium]
MNESPTQNETSSLLPQQNFGTIFAISAPSGCGKTTVLNIVLNELPEISRSVSVNTRAKRPGEIDGVDYIFVSPEQFDLWLAEGRFIEHVEIYGTKRGILKDTLFDSVKAGVDIVCIIDIRGVTLLKSLFAEHVVSIFLLPPSLDELQKRLQHRAADSQKEMEIRSSQAASEIEGSVGYDYCLMNDDLEKCAQKLKGIFIKERNKRRAKSRESANFDVSSTLYQATAKIGE